jgi:DNA-binding FadR family transcriptional regulator
MSKNMHVLVSKSKRSQEPMTAILKPVKQKLSHEVARQIARDIIDEGLQEGDFLGREPELLMRYSISRDTFREAIRVLEWQGLAKTTRGPSGGLVVAKPSQNAITNILRDYFDLTDVSFAEVIEARHRLQRLSVRLATMRLTDEVLPSLQQLLAEALKPTENVVDEIFAHLRLIHEIGRVSGNTVLSLFIAPLDYVAIDFADLQSLSGETLEKSRLKGQKILKRMVGAIIANEEGKAIRQVEAYIKLLEDVMGSENARNPQKRKIHPQWFDSGHSKFGQGLIYQIKQDIEDRGLEVGDRLGSEVELIKKYGVSRSIFREASRILELIGVSQSRKGRDGGLIVAKANPSNTIEAAAQFLEQAKLPFDQIYEARIALDTFAAELAAKRATDEQVAELEAALAAESEVETSEEFVAAASKLHSAICRASGNRVISLYIDILINSTVFRPTQAKQLKRMIDNKTLLVRSHERIIRDIKNKDAKSASRHMRDHRALVASYLEI